MHTIKHIWRCGWRGFFAPVALAIVFSAPCDAQQSSRVGDWNYILGTDISGASTPSESGATLNFLCSRSRNNCAVYITSESACDSQGSYPVLVDSPVGAANLTASCSIVQTGSGQIHALVLSPLSTVLTALNKDGRTVGFALPMVNGAFEVFRFSSTGASIAISNVTTAAEQPTGDQSL